MALRKDYKVSLLRFVFVIGERPDNIMLLGRSTTPIVRMDQCAAEASPSFSLPYQFPSLSKPYH